MLLAGPRSTKAITELRKMLANHEVSPSVAQAATGNVVGQLCWDFQRTKNRIERIDGCFERYCSTQQELVIAQRVVETQVRKQAIETASAKESLKNSR